MSEAITKVERKYMASAIIHGLQIEYVGFKGRACWDGDSLMPVTVGVTCEKLIKKGLLEELGRIIRKTPLAEKYRCKNCHEGRLVKFKEDDDDYEYLGDCPVCEGVGVVSKPAARR